MGINAGAAASIVVGIAVLATAAASAVDLARVRSAPALATVVVYAMASLGREGATPVKLALAGAAVTAGLTR